MFETKEWIKMKSQELGQILLIPALLPSTCHSNLHPYISNGFMVFPRQGKPHND
jgi:hypothetical protein